MEIVCKMMFVYIFKDMNIFGKGAQLCRNLENHLRQRERNWLLCFQVQGTSNAIDKKRSLGNPSFDPMLQSIDQFQKKRKKAAMKIVRPV